jgi:tetratricopeptide (TPR) repeat protein
MTYRALLPALLVFSLSACATQSSLDLYIQGQLQAEQGDLSAAMTALTAAIKENPRLGIAYVARANLYKQQGNYEQAAQDYEQVTKIEPYNFTANFQLGTIYQQLKKFAQAVTAFQKAVEVRPLDAQANMNLALSYLQMGQPVQGLYYAQRAVQSDEKSATAHANLGVLYAQAQYHSAAIESFKRAIELDSHQSEIYLDLGQEYFTIKSYDQARNVLETARSLAPSARISERLGATYYRLQNLDKAEEAYRDALRQDPNDIASLNGLGATLMSKALLASNTNVQLAKDAIDFWNRSLTLDKNQSAIQNLVNQYTPHE